jgi:PleD family two-component response regulator
MAIDSQRNSRTPPPRLSRRVLRWPRSVAPRGSSLPTNDDPQMRRLIPSVLPVIMLTALHGESEEKALDLGTQDYLTKPVQTRPLVAQVRAVLNRVTS